MSIKFKMLDPRMTDAHLGYIPTFLNEDDPRPAKKQFDEKYISGWIAFPGFALRSDNSLKYSGDPPLPPLAEAKLHGKETILYYASSWVAIIQPDRTYEVARLD